MKTALRLVERGLVPKPLIRRGIRRLLADRLQEQRGIFGEDHDAAMERWVQEMRAEQIAIETTAANEQHYEVPAGFFQRVLGRRLKYSGAFYPNGKTTLDEAEVAMLRLTSERAQLRDGQQVLELGCGWGSLTLWMAEQYPASQITAVSNSASQRKYINGELKKRGLSNVTIHTCDMNAFEPGANFDRVVSVEMFEHMRNWEQLLGRVAGWLNPGGKMFMHVFAHREYAYPFEVRDDADWMSRYFFTGGIMPSVDLVDRLDVPFHVDERWEVPGEHYARTSEDWLRNLESKKSEVMPILASTYGAKDAELWYHRWRVFFLACAELFGYDGGREWVVLHQRLGLNGGTAS